MLMQAIPPCPTPTPAATARWPMVVRCITALLGGYGAAAALSTFLARLLPIDRAEAWVWGTAILGGALLWLLGVRA
jgi:hypothetical protein